MLLLIFFKLQINLHLYFPNIHCKKKLKNALYVAPINKKNINYY